MKQERRVDRYRRMEKRIEKRILVWEPYFFEIFGLFHLHRIWGLVDRNSYAGFWLGVLENRGILYFVLMGILAGLCILGIFTFVRNWHHNYWWRWIYLFGGVYVLFDLFAIAAGLKFWNRLLLWMFDVNSVYWNLIWFFFVLLGGISYCLGVKLRMQRNKTM